MTLTTTTLAALLAAVQLTECPARAGATGAVEIREKTEGGKVLRWFEEMVPQADGVRLYTYGSVPPAGVKCPIVITRNPYVREQRTDMPGFARGQQGTLARGYARVQQHCRGAGVSEGVRIPYEDERRDGLALLDFVRRLPWYNGEIYLEGGSYLSSVHWAYLDTNPPDVKGAMLAIQEVDRYNICFRHGFFKSGLHGGWFLKEYHKTDRALVRNGGVTFRDFPLADFTQRYLGRPEPALDNVLTHPDRDDPFWKSGLPGSGAEARQALLKSTMPVLLQTGFYDIYTEGLCDMWRELPAERRANCALLIDAYDHGGKLNDRMKGSRGEFPGGARADEKVSSLDWFDSIRRGTPCAAAAQGRTKYYALWENAWHVAPELADGRRKVRLGLGTETKAYVYDPRAKPPPFPGSGGIAFGGMRVQPSLAGRTDAVTYLLPPVAERLDVRGRMTLDLAVRSDCGETAFYVRVSVDKGEGRFYLLRDDIRAVSCAAGETARVSYRFPDHAFRLEPGDRLRVDVASACEAFAPHGNVKGPQYAVRNPRVAHNAVVASASSLVLPVIAGDGTLAPADNAAVSDASGERRTDGVPTAPAKYRRPKGWTPAAPYPKTLREIARDHSAETMARARAQMEKVNAVNRSGKYAATGLGIDRHKCPEWFVDAKLGMFVDWGLYSIAAYSPYRKGARLYPDWYEYKSRPEYTQSDSAAAYHRKNWGADFKPDHFIALFRGERFDAPKMMKVFRACGAKYVVPFLKHHSGFCEWDCSYTFRDTVDSPAKRDFAREMADAARAEGLKFGVYNSQADEWEYPILQDDGSIRMKLWGGRMTDCTPDMETKASGKIAVKDFVYDYIVPQMTEFVDRYDPDILWFDADWSTRASENGAYDIAAYMYNRAEGRKEVCCNDRYGKLDPAEEAAFGRKGVKVIGCRTVRGDFFTDEWGDTAENIDPKTWYPWESCSGISKAYGNHWMEEQDPSMVMSDREFICHFADIVARGGNLLLLVNLDAQGAIPKVQEDRMLSIGKWLEKNGEAIYATRIVAPYSTPAVDYTRAKDGKTVYAIVKEPAAEVTLACELPAGCTVRLLGPETELRARRDGKKTVVTLPAACISAREPFVLRIPLTSG